MAVISYLPSHQPVLNYERNPSHFDTGRTKAQNSLYSPGGKRQRWGSTPSIFHPKLLFLYPSLSLPIHRRAPRQDSSLLLLLMPSEHVYELAGRHFHTCLCAHWEDPELRMGNSLGQRCIGRAWCPWISHIGHGWLRNLEAD